LVKKDIGCKSGLRFPRRRGGADNDDPIRAQNGDHGLLLDVPKRRPLLPPDLAPDAFAQLLECLGLGHAVLSGSLRYVITSAGRIVRTEERNASVIAMFPIGHECRFVHVSEKQSF